MEIQELPISKLKPADDNIRTDLGDLEELAASLKGVGLLEPLIVVDNGDGKHVVIAGNRRLAAARIAKLKKLPCIVRDLDDAQRAEVMLVENLQRAEISPLEEARGYQRLVDDHRYSQRKIASKVGVKQPHVSKRLKLLKLPDDVLAEIDSGDVTIEHGLKMAKLVDHPARLKKVLEASGYHREWTLNEQLRELADAAARKKAIAAIEADGLTYVAKAQSWLNADIDDDHPPTELPGVARQRQIDEETHHELDCHGVALGWNNNRTPVCTAPASHPPRDLDAEKEVHQAELDLHTRQAKEAFEARRTFMAKVVADVDLAADVDALGLVLDAFLERHSYRVVGARELRTILGLPGGDDREYSYDDIDAYASTSIRARGQVAMATALLSDDWDLSPDRLSWRSDYNDGEDERRLLEELVARGYKPHPIETEKAAITGPADA